MPQMWRTQTRREKEQRRCSTAHATRTKMGRPLAHHPATNEVHPGRAPRGAVPPDRQPNVLPVVIATKTKLLRQLFATGCVNSIVDVLTSAQADCEANRGGKSAPDHCALSCCQSLVPLPTLGRLSMERNVIQPMPAAGAIRPAAAESAARAECGKTPEPIRIMMPMPVPYCRTAVAASMPTNHCIAKLS